VHNGFLFILTIYFNAVAFCTKKGLLTGDNTGFVVGFNNKKALFF